MNLHQLQRKRLRETLGAAREARHVIHAQRAPLAKVMRLARAAERRLMRALKHLSLTGIDTDELAIRPDFAVLLDWQRDIASAAADIEKQLAKQLKRVEKAKDLSAGAVTDPSSARKKRKASNQKKRDRLDARWLQLTRAIDAVLSGLEGRLGELPPNQRDTGRAGLTVARKRDASMLTLYSGSSAGLPTWYREGLQQAERLIREQQDVQAQVLDLAKR